MKFKVGDLVRCVDDSIAPYFEGTREIAYVDEDSLYPYRLDGVAGTPWRYEEQELELAEEQRCAVLQESQVYCEPQPVDPSRLPPDPKRIAGDQKTALALIPPAAKLHCATAMEDGALKYGPFNWRETKVEAMTYLNAAYRHLDNWLDGEELTADTQVHNLGAVMACCAILIDAHSVGHLIDNRPSSGASSTLQEELKQRKADRAGTGP